MNEIWNKWEPVEGLKSKYSINSVLSDLESFEIVLSEDGAKKKNRIKFVFEGAVASYRDTNESFRLEKIRELDEQPTRVDYGQWTFFKVTNSEYIQWVQKQSRGIAEDITFIHFAFIDDDSILDVIACVDPRVEFIEKS